jgi:hypothetical protein
MEHISILIQRVMDIMEVIYHGYDYDAAIELKLRSNQNEWRSHAEMPN